MVYTDLFVKEKFNKDELWIRENLIYETVVGSQAYGLNTPQSDIDIVALVMPREEHLYPQRFGYILGFDTVPNFESKELKGEKKRIIIPNTETDLEGEWNSLVRFFYLAGLKGSPNLIECLFVRRHLVTFATDIAWKLRDNANMFLSLRTVMAFKGYAFAQLHRMRRDIKRGKTDNPKRQYMLEQFGMDVKQASQIIRLMDQINQVLDTGTIDLMNNKEEAKSVREGTWGTWERFEKYTLERLDILEKKSLNTTSVSPKPRLGELKVLLAECLEDWYGSELGMKKQTSEYVSVKDLMERLDKMEAKWKPIGPAFC